MRDNMIMKKVLSILLCLCMVLSCVPLDVQAEDYKLLLEISSGNIAITADSWTNGTNSGTKNDGGYFLSNSSSSNNITIKDAGPVDIVFSDLSISYYQGSGLPLDICGFGQGSQVNLELWGSSLIQHHQDKLTTDATLLMNANDSLNVFGGGSLTIHGSSNYNGGYHAIQGGNLTVRGQGTTVTLIGGNTVINSYGKAFKGGTITVTEGATVNCYQGALDSTTPGEFEGLGITVGAGSTLNVGKVSYSFPSNPNRLTTSGTVNAGGTIAGNVTINGGTVNVNAASGYAFENVPVLSSSLNWKVSVNGSPVPHVEKTDTMYTTNSAVKIEVCTTHEIDYTGSLTKVDDTTHKGTCKWCGYSGATEAHTGHYSYSANGNTITASCACGYSLTAELKLKVNADLTYTGSAIEPMEMVYPAGWPGATDATIQYTNNTNASTVDNKATATITVEGKTATNSFTITPGTMAVTANGYTGTFDTQAHGITVNAPAGATVKYGTVAGTYNLDASPKRTDVGTTTVYYQVTKDNYDTVTGSATVMITPGTMAVTANGHTGTFDGQAHGITVNAPEGTTIKYGTVAGTYNLDASPTQTGVGSITVYYQVTKENYNTVTGSATINITAKPLTDGDVTISFAPASSIYTGEDLTPSVTVKWGNKTLVAGTDYILSWSANSIVNSGTYTATVTAVDGGNFSGSKTADFVVGNAALTGLSVSQSGTLTYNGEAQTPTVNATATTVNGQPFTYAYRASENESYGQMPAFTNAGTYTVYYKASAPNHNDVEGSFTVTVNKQTVTPPAIASKVYSGTNQTADITVENTALYTLTGNAGGINCGSYDVVLTLKNPANYCWSENSGTISGENGKDLTLSFVITQAATTYTAPTANALIYNGEDQNLITAGSANGGQMQYSTDNENWSADIPQATNVGTYTVYYKVVGDSNHTDSEVGSVNVTIDKRPVTVTANDASKTYGDDDPAELTWTVTSGTELADEALIINSSRTEGENVGTYTITVSQEPNANPNYDITFVNGTFTINKAPMTVTAENKTAVYGDLAPQYTVTYSGFVNGEDETKLGGSLSCACDYAQFSNKGTYTITPSGYESGNYDITYVPGTLTVNPKSITVTIANKTSVYGKVIAELTATDNGIVNDDTNVYSLATTATSTANAGTYPITGTALDANYDITFVGGTYTITKAQAVATAPTAVSGLVYNKSAQTLIAAGSTNDGTMVYSLEKEGEYTPEQPQATAAGTYYVWYKVIGDGNHSDSAPVSVEVKIAKAEPGIGAVIADVVNDSLETSAIVLTRTNTNVAGNLIVDAGQTLVLGENEIAYTFVPTDTTNYKTVTGTVTVIVADTIAPTGTVTIATNNWTNFLNNITFGLFFKETQTVSVVATDNLSGVAKIEYIESKTAMDLDAVKAATQWTEMGSGSISVTLEDTKQFVYYIRITDKSGNVSYLSSDGAEYDTSAPVITGVNNGVTYYTSQTVTVTDKNIDTVTLNGEPATGSITLEGDKEATYTIVATDKAGNSTTVIVKMAPIADITDSMEGMTSDNVTSDDKAALQTIVDTVTELLKDEELPTEEKEALEKVKADAEALLKVIEDADKAADTENTGKVEDVTADNVTPDDKSDLEKAKADLEKALEDNGGNYTEDEKKAIEDELKRIDDALKVIENVEAVEDATSNLPATVVPDDEENVAKIEAAKKAYDALSTYEKSLVSKQTKETLDKLTAAAVAYDIIKGDGSEWTEGSNKTLSFTANGAVSRFLGIEINGKTVDPKHYEVKAGSTIVTLKQDYLDTLEAGKYTITFLYTNGETEGTFIVEAVEEETVPPTEETVPPTEETVPPTEETVPPTTEETAPPTTEETVPPTTEETKPGTVPETGDDANVMLWTTMLLFSVMAITALVVCNKKFAYKAKYIRK